jgi:hypothetical protein
LLQSLDSPSPTMRRTAAIVRCAADLGLRSGEIAALSLDDMIRTDAQGRGVINILASDKLMLMPKVYTAFLLWLLSELFERLPEVGDPEKPKLAFFFDEAHLLFTDVPKALLEKVEQVVRLIRSKGVGVYFITQNPLDVPLTVLGQLSNRVQHALRAFTPLDQKAVKSAAQTFRPNPKLDVAEAITQLGVGEALVSMLDQKGMPGIVQRAFMLPPTAQIGPIPPDLYSDQELPVAGRYETARSRVCLRKLQAPRPHSRRGPAPQERKPSPPLSKVLKAANSPVGRRSAETGVLDGRRCRDQALRRRRVRAVLWAGSFTSGGPEYGGQLRATHPTESGMPACGREPGDGSGRGELITSR